MAKKAGRNTKARIVAAAWRLFYEQGYEDTTVEDIVFESETSKGSFYHYFEGKDALLGRCRCCLMKSTRSCGPGSTRRLTQWRRWCF